MCLMVYLDIISVLFPCLEKNSVVNHLFGVCYFFTSLLKDIILYAIGFWNYYDFHSEPLLNKLLAKTISISEHNLLPPKQIIK